MKSYGGGDGDCPPGDSLSGTGEDEAIDAGVPDCAGVSEGMGVEASDGIALALDSSDGVAGLSGVGDCVSAGIAGEKPLAGVDAALA